MLAVFQEWLDDDSFDEPWPGHVERLRLSDDDKRRLCCGVRELVSNPEPQETA
jgi:hypothetical protein